MSQLGDYLLSLMIPPWHRPKLRITDLPNEYPRPWYYLYGRKNGTRREFDPWTPTAPALKARNRKRPIAEALEMTPPVAPQLVPPTSV